MLREFLRCGLLERGFARLWCSECRRSVLVAFSCDRSKTIHRLWRRLNDLGCRIELQAA